MRRRCGCAVLELLALSGGKGNERLGEVGAVHDALGVLGVDEQGARAAHDQKAHVGSGERVAQVLARGHVPAERLGRPGAEGVNHDIEAGQVLGGEVHDVLLDGLLGRGLVLAAHESGHVVSALHGLLHDELAGLAVCRHHCDLHVCYVLSVCCKWFTYNMYFAM